MINYVHDTPPWGREDFIGCISPLPEGRVFFDKAAPGRKINRRNSLGNAPHPTFIFRPDLFRTRR